jgi:hypothetical protein
MWMLVAVLSVTSEASTTVCMHAATVPECHFFQPLNIAVRQEDAAEAAKHFALCLRPDAAKVSLQNPAAALVTCITPSPPHSGTPFLLAVRVVAKATNTWS